MAWYLDRISWFPYCVNLDVDKGHYIVGRGAKSDCVLGGNAVSRTHCELFYARESWYIRDLGSKNGTFINDAKLSSYDWTQLQQGDVLGVGAVQAVADSDTFLFKVEHLHGMATEDVRCPTKSSIQSGHQNTVKDERDINHARRSPLGSPDKMPEKTIQTPRSVIDGQLLSDIDMSRPEEVSEPRFEDVYKIPVENVNENSDGNIDGTPLEDIDGIPLENVNEGLCDDIDGIPIDDQPAESRKGTWIPIPAQIADVVSISFDASNNVAKDPDAAELVPSAEIATDEISRISESTENESCRILPDPLARISNPAAGVDASESSNLDKTTGYTNKLTVALADSAGSSSTESSDKPFHSTRRRVIHEPVKSAAIVSTFVNVESVKGVSSPTAAGCTVIAMRHRNRQAGSTSPSSNQEPTVVSLRSTTRTIQLTSSAPDVPESSPVRKRIKHEVVQTDDDLEEGEIPTKDLRKDLDERRRRFHPESPSTNQRRTRLTSPLPMTSFRGSRRYLTGGGRPIPTVVASVPYNRNARRRRRRKTSPLREQLKIQAGLTGYTASAKNQISNQPDVVIMCTKARVEPNAQEPAITANTKVPTEVRNATLARFLAVQQQPMAKRRDSAS